MLSKHEYGFNLEDDLKALYGESYSEIDDMRKVLFLGMQNEPFEIRQLRNIIQNPVPITYDDFKHWSEDKLKMFNEYSLSYKTIDKVNLIETFFTTYHMN